MAITLTFLSLNAALVGVMGILFLNLATATAIRKGTSVWNGARVEGLIAVALLLQCVMLLAAVGRLT